MPRELVRPPTGASASFAGSIDATTGHFGSGARCSVHRSGEVILSSPLMPRPALGYRDTGFFDRRRGKDQWTARSKESFDKYGYHRGVRNNFSYNNRFGVPRGYTSDVEEARAMIRRAAGYRILAAFRRKRTARRVHARYMKTFQRVPKRRMPFLRRNVRAGKRRRSRYVPSF